MAAQFLTTSRLGNIINMIGLGRQSGILRVIRGKGPTRELGQIKFVDGDAVSALLGQLTGTNALGVLSNWGECIYSFDELPPENLRNSDPALDGGDRVTSDPGFGGGHSSGTWPSYGTPTGYPVSQPSWGVGSQANLPTFMSPDATMSGEPTGYDARMSGSGATSQPQNYAVTPDVLATVFRRSVIAEHTDQLPLDRRERMLLLLVDGRRNVSDLTRLTRRSEYEVLAVLQHLIGLGLVQQVR